MQTQSPVETVSVELQNCDSTSLVNQKSFENTHCEVDDRVVKIQHHARTRQSYKRKDPEPRYQIRRTHKKSRWSYEQELEYFYAAITFSCTNPYFTLSWEWWKPACFYNYLESHMDAIFKGRGKDGKQCKTKDQNLKIKYYEKAEQARDLITLSKQQLQEYVDYAKKQHKQGQKMEIQVLQRINRYQEALSQYQRFIQSLSKPNASEIQQQKLYEYSLQIRPQLQKLASELF